MLDTFANLFQTPPIMGYTINCVTLSPAFRQVIFVLAAVVFAASLLVLFLKNRPFPRAVRFAALLALLAASLVYALHADLGWSRWLVTDYRSYAGKTLDEKLLQMEGPLYGFVLKARQALPGDYSVLNDGSDNYYVRRFEYFMLPHRKRPNTPYYVVVGDREATYDLQTRTFTRGDLVVKNAQPVLLFMRDAYIVKKP